MSGTVLPPWTLPRSNTEKSIKLAEYVGCAMNRTTDVVKCLRKRPAKQLVEAQKNFMVSLGMVSTGNWSDGIHLECDQ